MVSNSEDKGKRQKANSQDNYAAFYDYPSRPTSLDTSFEKAMELISRGDIETIKQVRGPINRMKLGY